MIYTLLITIFIEAVIVIGYSNWRTKPTIPILLISIFANLITQFLLWIGLNLFYKHYLITLSVAEILIWLIESVILYSFHFNQLKIRDAFFLSLMMNLSSFWVGWFLPV